MPKQFPIRVLSNNIQLAGNIGSLFRIADTFGIEKIYFSGVSETASTLKIRKAARSTHKKIDYSVIHSENILKTDSKTDSNNNAELELIINLKKEGYRILCLEITSTSQELRKYVDKQSQLDKTCLVIGSEKKGIDQNLLDIADRTLHIPMFGANSSMNVINATAIALYELTQLDPNKPKNDKRR